MHSLGMVSLVNAARVSIGKGGLGWINPTLYKYSSSFANDITVGNNKCTSSSFCCTSGFSTSSGWDPVTGLGSINFANFKTVLTGLGNKLNIPTVGPVRAPTNKPAVVASAKPSSTAMPTVSNSGWMVKYTYNSEGCTGAVASVYAVPLGVCLNNYKVIGSSVYYSGYQMYSCNNGKLRHFTNATYIEINELLNFS